MNEVLNSGALSLASLAVSVVILVVGLALWFFVNRASSRTNEQIELLEALLDQQKDRTHCSVAFAKLTNLKNRQSLLWSQRRTKMMTSSAW